MIGVKKTWGQGMRAITMPRPMIRTLAELEKLTDLELKVLLPDDFMQQFRGKQEISSARMGGYIYQSMLVDIDLTDGSILRCRDITRII